MARWLFFFGLVNTACAYVAICGGSACMMPRDRFDNSSMLLPYSARVNVTVEFQESQQQLYATPPAMRGIAYSVTKQLNDSSCAYNRTDVFVSKITPPRPNLKCTYSLTFYSSANYSVFGCILKLMNANKTELVKIVKANNGAGLISALNITTSY